MELFILQHFLQGRLFLQFCGFLWTFLGQNFVSNLPIRKVISIFLDHLDDFIPAHRLTCHYNNQCLKPQPKLFFLPLVMPSSEAIFLLLKLSTYSTTFYMSEFKVLWDTEKQIITSQNRLLSWERDMWNFCASYAKLLGCGITTSFFSAGVWRSQYRCVVIRSVAVQREKDTRQL